MTRIAVLDDYPHLAAEAADWGTLDADVAFFCDVVETDRRQFAGRAPVSAEAQAWRRGAKGDLPEQEEP